MRKIKLSFDVTRPMSFFVCFVLLLITSCASYPSPRINNGFYTNPEYNFSFRIPPDWKASYTIPDDLKTSLPERERDNIKIVLMNSSSYAYIYIMADKIPMISFGTPAYEGFCKAWVNQNEEMKRRLEKNRNISFDYFFNGLDRFENDISEETVTVKRKEKKVIDLYPCQDDGLCYRAFCLISDKRTYDENYSVFKDVVDSAKN